MTPTAPFRLHAPRQAFFSTKPSRGKCSRIPFSSSTTISRLLRPTSLPCCGLPPGFALQLVSLRHLSRLWHMLTRQLSLQKLSRQLSNLLGLERQSRYLWQNIQRLGLFAWHLLPQPCRRRSQGCERAVH